MWSTRAEVSGNSELEKMVRLFGSEVADAFTKEEMPTGTSDAGDSRDEETDQRSPCGQM